ncbi:hypothetical protein SANTM175S_08270 [Streptomyces antimycoticus]
MRTQVASVLGHGGAEAVEAGRAFKELGFDSLTAVELRNRLNAATALRLPATLIYDYPNATALADHLRTELLGADAAAGGDVAAPAVAVADDPIAIVGDELPFPRVGCGRPRSCGSCWRRAATPSRTFPVGPWLGPRRGCTTRTRTVRGRRTRVRVVSCYDAGRLRCRVLRDLAA